MSRPLLWLFLWVLKGYKEEFKIGSKLGTKYGYNCTLSYQIQPNQLTTFKALLKVIVHDKQFNLKR